MGNLFFLLNLKETTRNTLHTIVDSHTAVRTSLVMDEYTYYLVY